VKDALEVSATFSKPLDWKLQIFTEDGGAPIFVTTGTRQSRTKAIWNGTSEGVLVEDGHYFWRLSGSDANGNFMAPVRSPVEVDRTAPVITSLEVTPRTIDGKRGRTTVAFGVSEGAQVKVRVKRRGRNFAISVVTVRLSAAGKIRVSWDGRNKRGNRVKPGYFNVEIVAKDRAGNKTINRAGLVRVK
jgi:hypothetical protein